MRSSKQPEPPQQPGNASRTAAFLSDAGWCMAPILLNFSSYSRWRAVPPGGAGMQIRAGYEIAYDCPQPTPMVLMLSVHPSRMADLATPHRIASIHPSRPGTTATASATSARASLPRRPASRSPPTFIISDTGLPDIVEPDAEQLPVQDLPDDVMLFLLGSRYCETDHLSNMAWSLFGNGPTGLGAGAGDLRLRPRAH